jgi:hypothetical protein
MDYDKFMRKADSLQARERGYTSVFQQKVTNDPDPYAPPTLISKGTVSTTLGGLVDLIDKSGGTTLFTYDPSTGVVQINGQLSLNANLRLGSTTVIDAPLVLTQGGTVINSPLLFESSNNGNGYISMKNSSGQERIALGISANGFGFGTIDQIFFKGNTNNGLFEFFGPSALLADSAGVHGFNIYNSDGNLLWKFASNGEVYQGAAKFFELKGHASDPGAAPTNSARLYIRDNGSGKSQFVVQFDSGTAVVLATEP